MGLTAHQSVELKRHLIQQGRHMDRPECGLSRRIEAGECYIGRGAALGARSILVYVQRGVGDHTEALEPVFRNIFSIHSKSGNRHWLGCFLFGCKNTQLAPVPVALGSSEDFTTAFVDTIRNHATGQAGPTDFPVVPSLSSPASADIRAHQVAEDDLLVFVCADNKVSMGRKARGEYQQTLVRNAIWVFVAEDGLHVDLRVGDEVSRTAPSGEKDDVQ